MKRISSPQNGRYKLAAALQNARPRKKQARFLVQGEREIRRLLEGRPRFREQIDEIFVNEDVFDQSTLKWLAGEFDPSSLFGLPLALFKNLSYGDREEPCVATVKRPGCGLESCSLQSNGFYLILDGIEKPGNLGAVFRTADGAGCDGILISDPMTDPFHPNAIRASMGTVFSIPFAIGSSTEVLARLQELGVETYAAVMGGESLFAGVSFRNGAAVVLGNEANGVGDIWLKLPKISLPMLGIADSLNISVAAAVFAYENHRQRSVQKSN